MRDLERVRSKVIPNQHPNARKNGLGRVRWHRAKLEDAQAALVEAQQISEGAACVDTDTNDGARGVHLVGKPLPDAESAF